MNKRLIKIASFFAIVCTCILCAMVYNLKIENVKADIVGQSCLKYVLSSPAGTENKSLYTNASGDNTLNKCELVSCNYLNQSGFITSDFQAIKGYTNDGFKSDNARGESIFYLSEDMKHLAQNNLLSVRLSVGLLALNNKEKSKITIKLSYTSKNGELIEYSVSNSNVYNSGTYNPYWSKTSYIALNDVNSPVKFSFQSMEGSWWNPAEFMIFEPTLEFKLTMLDSPTISSEKTTVHQGEVLCLSSNNSVTSYTSDSEYMKYLKALFANKYEIVSGSEFCSLYNNVLAVNDSVPNGSEIKVRTKCYESTSSLNVKYSSIITIKVNNSATNVKVTSNFPNASEIWGVGTYYVGEPILITQNTKPGYTFKNWVIGGEVVASTSKLRLVSSTKETIQVVANYIKDVYIEKVELQNKIFDSTCSASLKSVDIGNTFGYEAYIENLVMEFDDCNSGNGKQARAITKPYLKGKDACWFNLIINSEIKSYGNIEKRKVTIDIDNCSKIYGEKDPVFVCRLDNVLETDKNKFSLVRDAGENVGHYKITLATKFFVNYEIVNSNEVGTLTILVKNLTINCVAQDRVYNKTKNAVVTFVVSQIPYFNNSKLSYLAEFSDGDAGNKKEVKLISFSYNDNNCIIRVNSNNLFANILKAPLLVCAIDHKITYLNELPALNYITTGLLNGDSLKGSLSVVNYKNSVGTYSIGKGNLNNDNYEIDFVSATLTVSQKTIKIIPNTNQQKVYGEQDPDSFEYEAVGLALADSLNGKLERVSGESVGKYLFMLGTLNNNNYILSLQDGFFEIKQRECEIKILPQNKTFDGNVFCACKYELNDLVFNDNINIEISASFVSPFVATDIDVILNKVEINGASQKNYSFKYGDTFNASITKKNVLVSVPMQNFVYGEKIDVRFVATDYVDGYPVKAHFQIEDVKVGIYQPFSTDIYNLNPNYNIDLSDDKNTVSIISKEIYLKINNCEKKYCDTDPAFSISLKKESQLAYNDNINDFIINLWRDDFSQDVGNYEIFVELKYNDNYIFHVEKGFLSINKKNVQIEILDLVKTYGQSDPLYDFKCSESIFAIDPVFSRQHGEDVGKYLITHEDRSYKNYTITIINNAYLTITPKDVTVIACPATKFYGEKDQNLLFDTSSTSLAFNENIDDIKSGSIQREIGEEVGEYLITLGNLSFGANYRINFVSQKFIILKETATILISNAEKFYGENDPYFNYTISFLHSSHNNINVQITRAEGETVGQYILNAACDLSTNNFIINSSSAVLTIKKAIAKLVVESKQLVYGDTIKDIEFKLLNADIKDFSGMIYTDVDLSKIQDVGIYEIKNSLHNSNYNVEYEKSFIEIVKKEIKISLLSSHKTYSQNDPVFNYEVDPQDKVFVFGTLSRIKGENVGLYSIISSLTTDVNHTLNINNEAYLEIDPQRVLLNFNKTSKIYYENDPSLDYELISGDLDRALIDEMIVREVGEDVGLYKYNACSTENIVLELNGFPLLEILPLNVKLYAQAQSKSFDGTTRAYVDNIVVEGLFDDLFVDYDYVTFANYLSADAGNDKKIILSNISLVGEKSKNYILVLPELKSNITMSKLELGDSTQIDAKDSTAFSVGSKVEIKEIAAQINLSSSQQLLNAYQINLVKDDVVDNTVGDIAVSFDVDTSKYNNILVYLVNKDGSYSLLKSNYGDGKVVAYTSNLGEFVIVADNENWILYMSIAIISVAIISLVFFIMKKMRNAKRIKKMN